jgi:hypothetical protein
MKRGPVKVGVKFYRCVVSIVMLAGAYGLPLTCEHFASGGVLAVESRTQPLLLVLAQPELFMNCCTCIV